MASPHSGSSPRRSRGISFRSDRSHNSGDSGSKLSRLESHDEKARRNLHTKADPLIAMSEAQPSAFVLPDRVHSPLLTAQLTGDSGCRAGKVQFGLFEGYSA